MKKAILFAILALSINAFAQINQSTKYLQFPKLDPLGKIRVTPADMLLNKTFNFSDKLSAIGFKNKLKELNASFHINDSIYNWQWDTISYAWKVAFKTIKIVYNVGNNLTSNLMQDWNGSTWENNNQHAYTYDANNNRTSELWQIYYNWDGGSLGNFTYNTYTYDANNNLTIEKWYSWAGSDWGTNPTTITRTYDANNNKISEYWEGGYATTMRTYFTYDASNNNTNITEQINSGGIWVNYMQSSFTFDANNNQISSIEKNGNGSDWVNSRKDTLTYDANNNQLSVLSQTWNGSTWVNSSLGTSTYDSYNNRIGDLFQNWTGSAWVNSSKDTLTYDANKNNTSYFGQNWSGSAWVNSSQNTQTYDINNFTLSEVRKYWNTDGIKVTSGDSTHYYFHTVVTGVQNLDKSGISVYPNPTIGKFTISSNNTASAIEIYNLSGVRVYSDFKFKNHTSNEIDLSGYAKGIYLVKIYDGTQLYNRKVIVQ